MPFLLPDHGHIQLRRICVEAHATSICPFRLWLSDSFPGMFHQRSEEPILLPFFSIILPTYNRVMLLDRALESVLAQSDPEWELLITDDGSTDDSWTSLCDWTRRDDRIRCWRHGNRGQAASRNEMLQYARAPWIVFLDSDDEFLPEHLALRHQAITAAPAVELWISPMRIVGSPLVPCRIHPGALIHIDRCIGAGMLTVQREALMKVGGFPNLRYAEESGLMTRLLAAGIRPQRLPHRSYVYHRGHSDTITHNQLGAARTPEIGTQEVEYSPAWLPYRSAARTGAS